MNCQCATRNWLAEMCVTLCNVALVLHLLRINGHHTELATITCVRDFLRLIGVQNCRTITLYPKSDGSPSICNSNLFRFLFVLILTPPPPPRFLN